MGGRFRFLPRQVGGETPLHLRDVLGAGPLGEPLPPDEGRAGVRLRENSLHELGQGHGAPALEVLAVEPALAPHLPLDDDGACLLAGLAVRSRGPDKHLAPTGVAQDTC